MRRITNQTRLIERVCSIVQLHMRAGELSRTNAKNSTWKRLHRKMRLDILGWVSKADSAGRTGRSIYDKHRPSELCFEWCNTLGLEEVKPLVQGRDLIKKGLKPSPLFSSLLRNAMELQLEGLSKEEILSSIL